MSTYLITHLRIGLYPHIKYSSETTLGCFAMLGDGHFVLSLYLPPRDDRDATATYMALPVPHWKKCWGKSLMDNFQFYGDVSCSSVLASNYCLFNLALVGESASCTHFWFLYVFSSIAPKIIPNHPKSSCLKGCLNPIWSHIDPPETMEAREKDRGWEA